jgi:hypothetical protein
LPQVSFGANLIRHRQLDHSDSHPFIVVDDPHPCSPFDNTIELCSWIRGQAVDQLLLRVSSQCFAECQNWMQYRQSMAASLTWSRIVLLQACLARTWRFWHSGHTGPNFRKTGQRDRLEMNRTPPGHSPSQCGDYAISQITQCSEKAAPPSRCEMGRKPLSRLAVVS